jgi:hypothetical protein
MDIDDYINGLIARIDYLEKLTDSLHKEIRTQRKEIGALREERRMVLNKDQYPEYDPLGEIP